MSGERPPLIFPLLGTRPPPPAFHQCRKTVSQSKITTNIHAIGRTKFPNVHPNCFPFSILQMAEEIMQCFPMFNTGVTVFTPSQSVLVESCVCPHKQLCRCYSDRLKYSFFTVKISQNKSSKFREMEKQATFPTLLSTPMPTYINTYNFKNKKGEYKSVSISVRKLFSRSKFTAQILTSQTEQNFQLCARIILLLRVAEQFMQHLLIFNIFFFGRTVFTPSMSVQCACRTLCFPAPAPVQMPFRLGFAQEWRIRGFEGARAPPGAHKSCCKCSPHC